jgi:sugar/nucleoside kinase (ribokinase family)
MSILVLGTVALDTVKTPFGSRRALLGGSAAHFAMSARLFTAVDLVAIVGEDFPRAHIAFLQRKGVCLHSLVVAPGKTFQWSGEYKGDLNAALTLSTELGVLTCFKPYVTKKQRAISNIFLANVDPEIQLRLLSQMQSPRLIGLDSMNYWIHNKRKPLLKLLKSVHIFVANDQEARDLSGEANLIKAARRLREFGPPMVLIKKGEHGVTFFCDSFIFSLPAYPTEDVIDPTGAGDTFAGGFMGYLAKGGIANQATIKRALMYGTIAASFNVEGFGMERTSSLTLPQIEKRLAHFKKCISVV